MDKIIAAMRAQGATEADIEAYVRSVGGVEAPAEPAAQPEVKKPSFLKGLVTDTRAAESVADAATWGLSGAAADALDAMFSPTRTFQSNRDARKARRESMGIPANLAAGVTGAIMNPTSVYGPVKTGAGAIKTLWQGMKEGSTQGMAAGMGENIGTSDDPTGLVHGGIGLGFGGIFGGTAAAIARKFARRGIDPIAEAAARRAQEAANADKALAYTLPVIPAGRGMPEPMELDRAGPTMLAHARGAAKSVPGRAVVDEAFATRDAQMMPSLTGGVRDAVEVGNTLKAQRKAQAKADYGAAIEATKGQPIQTPLLDALRQTPTGQAAWLQVVGRRPDRVLGTGDPARALPMASVPGGVEHVPDAEAIHEMTRLLNKWAKGEKGQVFPEGVDAISAGDALSLLKRAKDELPEPFRVANERYAEMSRKIDAIETGRTPWKVNPNPLNKKALPLADQEAAVAAMSPVEQALAKMGKTFDVASRINEGTLTPATAAKKLANPESSLARELNVAGGTLGERLKAWDAVNTLQKDVAGGKGEALDQPPAGVMSWLADKIIAPTAAWMAVKGGRELIGAHAANRAKDVGKMDAEFLKMLTSKPGTLKGLLDALAMQDETVGTTAAKASARAGRVGGLLFR